MMLWPPIRSTCISVFVVFWFIIFNYESIRLFYLEPFLQRSLPKVKFLFPPAGWPMFYEVGDRYGYAEVYGVKNGRPQLIDPHAVLQTRAIGYDNINRNALVSALERGAEQSFCAFLRRKFAYFDSFLVVYAEYPSVTKRPFEQLRTVAYECR